MSKAQYIERVDFTARQVKAGKRGKIADSVRAAYIPSTGSDFRLGASGGDLHLVGD